MKWIAFIGFVALYTFVLYLVFRPKIQEHNDIAKQNIPYFEKEGFKTDTVRITEFKDKLIPYPIEMPPQKVMVVDTQYYPKEVVRYIPQDSLGPSISIPKYYGKYPFLVAGDFSKDNISLTLADTSGNIRTEIFPTMYSDYKYRYTNSSMSSAQSQTRTTPKSTRSIPLVQYDKTFVEYKHDFINSGKSVGISTGVTIKDRIRLTGFGELGLNNNIPDQAGVKVGLKLF